jgi:hypothetical protein
MYSSVLDHQEEYKRRLESEQPGLGATADV